MLQWHILLLCTCLCMLTQMFFTMQEMACLSFNRVRLQYYVSKKDIRAIWLSRLIQAPALLFGTVMLGINTAMILGSELARRFFLSLGLSPDWAALSQSVLVIIFAEVSPMFAGRRYAEDAAMKGIPLLYGCSLVFRPVIWLFNLFCKLVYLLFASPREPNVFLTRDELQKILEERDDKSRSSGLPEFDAVVRNIFTLKNSTAALLMQPLSTVSMAPAHSSIADVRGRLAVRSLDFLPLYLDSPENIVAIAYPRDLLRKTDNAQARPCARQPWFIVEDASIFDILQQFRRNNHVLAVVLDVHGQAVGILTLDDIIDGIFGQKDTWNSVKAWPPTGPRVFVNRTFPGSKQVADISNRYHIDLSQEKEETLEELCERMLGRPVEKGDTVRIGHFELVAEEVPLIGEKAIAIRSV